MSPVLLLLQPLPMLAFLGSLVFLFSGLPWYGLCIALLDSPPSPVVAALLFLLGLGRFPWISASYAPPLLAAGLPAAPSFLSFV